MDCTGLHSAAHCCTGLHWAVLGSTGLYWTVLGCTGLCLAANVRYGSQKLYGLFGLNHHMLEKMCDVTPVTGHGQRTNGGGKWKIVKYSGRPEIAIS